MPEELRRLLEEVDRRRAEEERAREEYYRREAEKCKKAQDYDY